MDWCYGTGTFRADTSAAELLDFKTLSLDVSEWKIALNLPLRFPNLPDHDWNALHKAINLLFGIVDPQRDSYGGTSFLV
jgi:hypothetical protein